MKYIRNWVPIRLHTDEKKGVYFAVWAPNAQSVSVIGEFNDWEEEANPMEKVGPIGVYEVLFRGQRLDNCINSLSWVRMERSYIKQILMQMKLNSSGYSLQDHRYHRL